MTHEQASFNDLRDLANLVSALYVFIFQPHNPILMLIHDVGDLVCSLLDFKLVASRKWHLLSRCSAGLDALAAAASYYGSPVNHCTEYLTFSFFLFTFTDG